MNLTDNRIQQIIGENGGNFTPEEFGERRANLAPSIVGNTVAFRNWHGYSTLITSAYREEGAHSIAAVDKILFRQWKKSQPSAMELWRLATTWPWQGVGIYFDWEAFGQNVIGLHCDLVDPSQRDRPLRWLRREGEYYYQVPADGRFYHPETGKATTLRAEIERYKGTG